MFYLKLFCIILFLSLLSQPLIFCDIQNTNKIRIIVYDLDLISKEINKETANMISSTLRNLIAKKPIFEVVSRSTTLFKKQFDELKLQLSGITTASDNDIKNRINIGKILNAKNAITGSIGKAFDTMIITIQLFDMETGIIITTESKNISENKIIEDLTEIAVKIADEATGNAVKIELKDIRTLIDTGNYEKAKELLYNYMRQSGVTAETKDLQALINRKVAEIFYNKSREMYDNNFLERSKEYILEAMDLDENNQIYKDFSLQINNKIQEIENNKILQEQKEKDKSLRDEEKKPKAINYSDGSKYYGQVLNQLKQGYGTYYFINGDKYEGNWIEDKMSGHGVYYFANGDKYDGEYIGGRPSGGWYFKSSGDKSWAYQNNGSWVINELPTLILDFSVSEYSLQYPLSFIARVFPFAIMRIDPASKLGIGIGTTLFGGFATFFPPNYNKYIVNQCLFPIDLYIPILINPHRYFKRCDLYLMLEWSWLSIENNYPYINSSIVFEFNIFQNPGQGWNDGIGWVGGWPVKLFISFTYYYNKLYDNDGNRYDYSINIGISSPFFGWYFSL